MSVRKIDGDKQQTSLWPKRKTLKLPVLLVRMRKEGKLKEVSVFWVRKVQI